MRSSEMKKKNLWAILATVIMALPLFVGFGGTSANAAGEDPVESTTQKVILHKMFFEDLEELPTINNTGDEITSVPGTPLDGAVFTAYDATATYWGKYDETEGTDAAKTAAAQAEVLITLDASKPGTPTVFEPTAGGVTSEDLAKKSLDQNGKERNAIYVFVETKSPAGVVSESSVPFVLGLPVYNEIDGVVTDSEKTEVHVYPKNLVKTNDLKFTKYGVDENGKATVLDGANFILKSTVAGDTKDKYLSTENTFTATGEDDATVRVFTSAGGGLVPTGDLKLEAGDYEFYEIDSTVSDNDKAATPYHYGKNPVVIVHVDEKMNVTYTYYDVKGEEKSTTENGAAKAYNYAVPSPTKEAGDHDVNVGQDITFTITQPIPDDIADYKTFKLTDDYNDYLELVSDLNSLTFNILDESGANFGTVNATVSESTDPDNSTMFTVSFDTKSLVDFAGKTISFEVVMSVKEDAPLDTDIENEITLENDFQDKGDKDTVKTYGKSFVKTDADSDATLNGAEFVIKKGEQYLVQVDGKVDWTDDINAATKFVSGDVNGDGKYDETDVDADGTFSVEGLALTENGEVITYQLEETKAPDGYVLSKTPIDFTVDHDGTIKIDTVVNKHKGSLPSTGGTGIIAFVAIGVVAVAGAVLYFTKGRRQIEG